MGTTWKLYWTRPFRRRESQKEKQKQKQHTTTSPQSHIDNRHLQYCSSSKSNTSSTSGASIYTDFSRGLFTSSADYQLTRGIEAPRNSLELDPYSLLPDIPFAIQVIPRIEHKSQVEQEIRRRSCCSTRPVNVVARLMGLDPSPDRRPPVRLPLQPRRFNSILEEMRHGTRSLPESPRASSARLDKENLPPATKSIRPEPDPRKILPLKCVEPPPRASSAPLSVHFQMEDLLHGVPVRKERERPRRWYSEKARCRRRPKQPRRRSLPVELAGRVVREMPEEEGGSWWIAAEMERAVLGSLMEELAWECVQLTSRGRMKGGMLSLFRSTLFV